jgi:26S proteasome regulatory subunit N2
MKRVLAQCTKRQLASKCTADQLPPGPILHLQCAQVQSTLDALAPASTSAAAPAAVDGEVAAMDTDAEPAAAPAAPAAPAADTSDPITARYENVKGILSGKTPLSLYLYFLHRNNHADLQILKNIKNTVDARVSVLHSATILANAYMHAGTTVDTFLRENLDWLSRATNWVKFSATAGLGVIHRGHLQHGKAHMMPYLPRNGHSGSPFSEGGALYALGLIHANHSADIKQFLLEQLRNTGNEVTQHGACLGLGLAALGTNDEEVFEDIKGVLYTDSAVAGESAGIGMGLLLVGSASDKAQEMLAYAHDTQHEKIIRGLVMGLALIMYGREEGAEGLVEQMTRDQDPIIRYGGMMVIGLAYRGTGNNAAVQKLLHFAVSDVNDDVRRAAVMCLGFVLMGKPELCPTIVSLLAESYNPHVRYGAAMAVGLACAGSGLKEAVALLEPMLKDPTDFVRQGALIASALVMIQQPESRLASFRKVIDKFIGDKHEEVMGKMGAIMAAGIIDAGARARAPLTRGWVCAGARAARGCVRSQAVVCVVGGSRTQLRRQRAVASLACCLWWHPGAAGCVPGVRCTVMAGELRVDVLGGLHRVQAIRRRVCLCVQP